MGENEAAERTRRRIDTSGFPFVNSVDGYPARSSAEELYDDLDYQRAVQVYLWAIPFVSACASIEGAQRDFGTTMQNIPIFEEGARPRQVLLTANSQSIYSFGFLDLSNGPVVFEAPASGLGGFNNIWQYPLADIGPLGPDEGNGGKFLLLPPGYDGAIMHGYFVVQSDSFWVIWLNRGARVDGKAEPAIQLLETTRIYPLAQRQNPPKMTFFNASAMRADNTFPTGYEFWEVLHRGLQHEPVRSQDKAMLGLLTALGIEKGKPFPTEVRARAILERAAQKGLELARTIAFESRRKRARAYPGRQWERLFLADSVTFESDAFLDIDARVTFTYGAEFTSPAMMQENVGVGSQYLAAYRDADGNWLDGAQTYTLHIDPDVPAKDFWSVMVYDAVTRSMNDTDQGKAGLDSYENLETNPDGSIDLHFGPEPPASAANWVKTRIDRGFFLYFRAYGPLQPFFDQTWRLNDVVRER